MCGQSKLNRRSLEDLVSIQDFSDLAMCLGPCKDAWTMLKKIDSLASHNWFHGMISKELSEHRIVQNKEQGEIIN